MRDVTLVDIFAERAARQADELLYTFLGGEDERVTYGALWARAAGIARQVEGLTAPGDRVLLLHPNGSEFVAAFLACLLTGRVPVPLAAPTGGRFEARVALVAHDCEARLALVPATAAGGGAAPPGVIVAPTTRETAADWRPTHHPRGGDACFLQYTSGSTGSPRGVVVTHGNLMANQMMIGHAFGSGKADIGMGWLPLYHDMGLIGKALHPLFQGFPVVLMSPFAFLQQPLRWLRAISAHRATISGAPDFAFALCAKKAAAGPAALAGLDLSSWRVAFTGAEPVRRDTLDAFARAFAGAGFSPRAFLPCYGLAEATLIVTGGARSGEALRVDGVERVACGTAVPRVEALAVDAETRREVAPGQVGEIWVKGPSVARGYWRAAQGSASSFGARLADGRGPYLRTGDLGAFVDGALAVTGRLKDLVIVAGKNHYPSDLETTCEGADGLVRAGACAAFGVDAGAGEALVVLLELDREGAKTPPADLAHRQDRLRVALASQHGLMAHDIVFLRPGALPRTTSGKLRRSACRELYAEQPDDLAKARLAALRR